MACVVRATRVGVVEISKRRVSEAKVTEYLSAVTLDNALNVVGNSMSQDVDVNH